MKLATRTSTNFILEWSPLPQELFSKQFHQLIPYTYNFRACLFGLWLAGYAGKAVVQQKLLRRKAAFLNFSVW
jgi:hypothetical protein